ncbi:PQQ-like beta-propeller repeat protein [Methylobacter sp. S3L5C]|nr:PQQ-like beta-propeller repeat protein [Methylobacter sp. S3L5C]
MKFTLRYCSPAIAILASIILISSAGLYGSEFKKSEHFTLERLFPGDALPSVTFDDSIIASPLLDLSQGRPLIIVPASNGLIAALDGETGALDWQVNAPTPKGQLAQLISTPIIINNKLVILYQCLTKGVRTSHRLAVIDLAKKQLDEAFPVLVLSAEKPTIDGIGTVKFNPPTAFSHSALKHALKPDSNLGYLYAAFGNSGDEQPYHGWLFEIDLDAWHTDKKELKNTDAIPAISSVLLTTPETDCPVTKEFGNQEMICGGGIWTPADPQIYQSDNDFELFVPTGNGQINLDRHDFANTIMRVKPGLKFDAGCDANLCANFNPTNPDRACMASCKNLFIPRLLESDLPLNPASGDCNDKSFWECLAWMDYDLGASAPVKVNMATGYSVLVQASKDGSVYLIDAEHLGTQYDRLQLVDLCGTKTDECKLGWMGMIVTQPVVTFVNDTPIVVIPAFVADKTHPAGLIALKIVMEKGQPKFKRFWQFPDPSSPKALKTFRSHPSLPVINTPTENGNAVVWIIDINTNGTIYGVRIKDGALVAKQTLAGAGRPLSSPLIYGNKLYVASIMPDTNKAMIEAYQINTAHH